MMKMCYTTRTAITLETVFCLEALDQAFEEARPEIFNNDQGSQLTSTDFTDRLQAARVRISWDGRGRALDTIFVERLWRSVRLSIIKHSYRCITNHDSQRSLLFWVHFCLDFGVYHKVRRT